MKKEIINKEIVYICGKVSGLPIEEVHTKFMNAQRTLESEGYVVVNPIHVVEDSTTPWMDAMRLCISALMDCDCIFLLPDYVDSKGARLEKEIAQRVGIKLIREKELKHA